MLRILALFEDSQIAAEAHDDGLWHTTVVDGMSGRHHTVKLSNMQLAAIFALAIGLGEDAAADEAHHVEWLYALAVPALEGCPADCIPYP